MVVPVFAGAAVFPGIFPLPPVLKIFTLVLSMQEHAITIDRPMVLIPAEEYRELLVEAGYLKTPKLDKRIKQARRNFFKGKSVSWKKVKERVF